MFLGLAVAGTEEGGTLDFDFDVGYEYVALEFISIFDDRELDIYLKVYVLTLGTGVDTQSPEHALAEP